MGLTLTAALKILGVALAVGLDTLALSIAIGIMHSEWRTRLRLAIAFAFSEVFMQVAGYLIGAGVGRVIGSVTDYLGFGVLAIVGVLVIRESYRDDESQFDANSLSGLILSCASISLDSLGIGVSLPGVPLPLIPLLATVAVSTTAFTLVGLKFGSLLGERYEELAQRTAGIVLILLAATFTIQHIEGWTQ
jgi:putative Mn2+ efflux pump MntP